jgi:FKBP-type peptidyl-prolyl cis-trans isomerase 2
LTVNIDNLLATIRSVSGGRILVDFNHPLAGKEVEYTFKATKKITEPAEKIEAVISMELNLKKEGYELAVQQGSAKIKFKKGAEVPKEMREQLAKRITELTGVAKIDFE